MEDVIGNARIVLEIPANLKARIKKHLSTVPGGCTLKDYIIGLIDTDLIYQAATKETAKKEKVDGKRACANPE